MGDATVLPGDTRGREHSGGAEKEFRIGLALAGAISAGAYTAGVIDFLIEALETWEQARGQAGVPDHRTGLKVVAGASAGAITGAVSLIALARGVQPRQQDAAEMAVLQGNGGPYNPKSCVLPALYKAWVEQPRLMAETEGALDLLDTRDLQAPSGKLASVASVLNSQLLDSIRDEALRGTGVPASPRPYLADDMHLYMTVSNLRGIPFKIGFGTGQYGMQTHGDRVHYKIEGVGGWQCGDGAWLAKDPGIALSVGTLPVQPDGKAPQLWQDYGTVALASAAFPIGLESREITCKYSDYFGRRYPIDADEGLFIEPDFPNFVKGGDDPYRFRNVDGGLINNNPFDYVEYALLGRPSARRSVTIQQIDAALLMIAPFPEPPAFLPDGQPTAELAAVIKSLLPTLMTQARFRTDDLVKALDPNNYSRYLIAPHREDPATGMDARFRIACGALGGFGGFLDQSFRAHDYQLGRRNCQQFLRKTFGLPLGASALDDKGHEQRIAAEATKPEQVRVIPLLGEAALEVGLPPWPRMSEPDLARLWGRIEQRMEMLLPILIKSQTKSRRLRLIGSAALLFGRRQVLSAIRWTVTSDLVRRDQVAGWDLPPSLARRGDAARAVLAELASPAFDYRTIAGLTRATRMTADEVRTIVDALRGATGNPRVVTSSWDPALFTLAMRAPSGFKAWPGVAPLLRWLGPPSLDTPDPR